MFPPLELSAIENCHPNNEKIIMPSISSDYSSNSIVFKKLFPLSETLANVFSSPTPVSGKNTPLGTTRNLSITHINENYNIQSETAKGAENLLSTPVNKEATPSEPASIISQHM